MEELLSLKWNNHRSTFIHIIAGLREKQSYTDVTLACDGKFYSVHKLVLSTCSEYFSAMFDKTPCKNPVIVLKDIKSDDLDALLDYMYLGEVNVRQSDLASLIKAAECLRIKGLAVPDDEPPKKMGPGRAGSSNAPERRTDSPPAKRKRREGSEESREDSRHSSQQPHPAQAQTPPPSSSRPKTPPGGTQRHSPVPHPPRPSQSSPSEGGRAPSPTHPPVVSPAERTTPQSRGGGESEGFDQSAPFVKVEMDDGGQGDPLGDSYDVPSDGYKEESEVGGDLSNDFPEFLQAAAAGTLPGNASSFTHNYPGTSGFHHDLTGWQGEQPLGGSFSGLNFPHTSQDSSQNAQPGGVGVAAAAWGRDDALKDPPLVCQVCGKVIVGRNRKQKLKYHLITHTGERAHKCPLCPYRASLKFTLNRHIRTVHSEATTSTTATAPSASIAAHSAFPPYTIMSSPQRSEPGNVHIATPAAVLGDGGGGVGGSSGGGGSGGSGSSSSGNGGGGICSSASHLGMMPMGPSVVAGTSAAIMLSSGSQCGVLPFHQHAAKEETQP